MEKDMGILEEKLLKTESQADLDPQEEVKEEIKEEAKEESQPSLEKKTNRKGVSVMVCDRYGTIHAFNKLTSKMFHVSSELLKGKNFFKLMSEYSRSYWFETYGESIFKTFRQTSKTLRYSLPHMDDVDSENFFVLTSKLSLVQPKSGDNIISDQYMIKIWTRPSSKENTAKLYRAYTQARKEIREEDRQEVHFIDREPPYYAPMMELGSGNNRENLSKD